MNLEGTSIAGVVADVRTRIDDVFTISNHGTQAVTVWIDAGTDLVTFYDTTGQRRSIDGRVNATILVPGEIIEVGFEVDYHHESPRMTLLERILIHAFASKRGTVR